MLIFDHPENKINTMVNTFIVIDRCGWGIQKSGAEQVDKTMGM